MSKNEYDVIVVGAGHAGCEAALAAARMGCRTALITIHLDTIAQMSCNPAIGGLAKGQLVREIDALGGAMAKAIDATGIQFRVLNARKGPAVQSPRAQADKKEYQGWMKLAVESASGVHVLMDEVTSILVEDSRICGVYTSLGIEYLAPTVVLTTGTFLKGKVHIGKSVSEGGRYNEKSANFLSGNLEALGFPLGRLKTGTPARINADTIDFSRLELQPGDESPRPFSFTTHDFKVDQVPCYMVHTNEETHRIVTEALPDSPLFSGQIQGVGPRYCPSFELKVHRFPDRTRHLVYLEPEGRKTKEVYLNGMSTSLAHEVQEAMVHSVTGLEEAEIMRYGYAVEYDYVPPRCLHATLETKTIKGLYHAGQINGTSGYEEAAAQGLMAGANAALAVQKREAFTLDRSDAYIGVLIDDLVTKGTDEPYRLFTSRAEYRLLLRSDNADLRLTPKASALGLVSPERAQEVEELKHEIESTEQCLHQTYSDGLSLEKRLRQQDASFDQVATLSTKTELQNLSERAKEQIEINAKYAGYITRQLADIEKYKKMKSKRIPDDFDYAAIKGLRVEAREKLIQFRPEDLEDASRISGVSPADTAIIAVHLHRRGAPEALGAKSAK